MEIEEKKEPPKKQGFMSSVKNWFSSDNKQPKKSLTKSKSVGKLLSQPNEAELLKPQQAKPKKEKIIVASQNKSTTSTHDDSIVSAGSGNICIQRQSLNMAKVKNLKPTFASKCLDKEMAIQSGNYSHETVGELLELYDQAVQYYNVKGDRKFLFYQEKIQDLMMNSEIMLVLTSKPTQQQLQQLRDEEKKAKLEKLNKATLQHSIETDPLCQEYYQVLMEHFQQAEQRYVETIKNREISRGLVVQNLKEQRDLMNVKLGERKAKKDINSFCEKIVWELTSIVNSVMALKEEEETCRKAKQLEKELFENSQVESPQPRSRHHSGSAEFLTPSKSESPKRRKALLVEQAAPILQVDAAEIDSVCYRAVYEHEFSVVGTVQTDEVQVVGLAFQDQIIMTAEVNREYEVQEQKTEGKSRFLTAQPQQASQAEKKRPSYMQSTQSTGMKSMKELRKK